MHQQPAPELTEAELGKRYSAYSQTTAKSLKDLDHEALDYDLIRDLVLWIMETEADVSGLPKGRQGIWGANWDDAEAAFRDTIRVDANHALAHWNLSLALLSSGRFEEGFREMKWRWRWPKFPGRRAERQDNLAHGAGGKSY